MWREMEDEIARLRVLLAKSSASKDGELHCENAKCLATIDLPLVASSRWAVDNRGWWFCPEHEDEGKF